MGGDATRSQLRTATLAAIRDVGFGGLSARLVARYADVNQALIFYHYGSMDGLVAETCREATGERVAVWARELQQVDDLPSLVALARRLHAHEAQEGNVAILAQALAVSQTDDTLAPVVGGALRLWLDPLEATAARILAGTLLEGVVSPAEIARAAAAAFVGTELFDGVVPAEDHDPFEVLERIALLGTLVLEAGPLTRAAVRRRLRAVRTPATGAGRT